MNEILRIKNLTKSFYENKVLDKFDMTLEKGKVYGLLGKNGAGKTTLIRMILGVIPADKGEIAYKNKKLSFGDAAYKKELGYIPEDSIFFEWMTIQQILDFNSAFYPKWDREKAKSYLDRFSLEGKIRVKNLSRGMKLKLGLILALAADPELLILDDPTSGLDVPTRHDFLRDIIREIVDRGTTILFSSHLVHELEGIIEHLGILHSGRLVLDEELFQVKNSIKRVRIGFDKTIPEKIPVHGILSEHRENNRAELVIYPWHENTEEQIKGLGPEKVDLESLSLEDIFISFVS